MGKEKKYSNDHLRDLRLKHGLTQQEVADKIGVTKATISKYEKGLRGIKHIQELSDLFNVDPIYILMGITADEWRQNAKAEVEQAENEERQYWESILLTDSVLQLMPLLDKLNDDGQQKAVERVEELTEIPKYQRQETPPEAPQDPPEGK